MKNGRMQVVLRMENMGKLQHIGLYINQCGCRVANH